MINNTKSFYESLMKKLSIFTNATSKLDQISLFSCNSVFDYCESNGVKNSNYSITLEIHIYTVNFTHLLSKLLYDNLNSKINLSVVERLISKLAKDKKNFLEISIDNEVTISIRIYKYFIIILVIDSKNLPNSVFTKFLSDHINSNFLNFIYFFPYRSKDEEINLLEFSKVEDNKDYLLVNEFLLLKIYEVFFIKYAIFHFEKIYYHLLNNQIPDFDNGLIFAGYLCTDIEKNILLSHIVNDFNILVNSQFDLFTDKDSTILNEIIFHGTKLHNQYKKFMGESVLLDLQQDYAFVKKVELTSTFPRIVMFIKYLPVYNGLLSVHFYTQLRLSRIKEVIDESQISFLLERDKNRKFTCYHELSITDFSSSYISNTYYSAPDKIKAYEDFIKEFLMIYNPYAKEQCTFIQDIGLIPYFNPYLFDFLLMNLKTFDNANSLSKIDIEQRVTSIKNNLKLLYEDRLTNNLNSLSDNKLKAMISYNDPMFIKIDFDLLLTEMFGESNKIFKLKTLNFSEFNSYNNTDKVNSGSFISEVEKYSIFSKRNTLSNKLILNNNDTNKFNRKSKFHTSYLQDEQIKGAKIGSFVVITENAKDEKETTRINENAKKVNDSNQQFLKSISYNINNRKYL